MWVIYNAYILYSVRHPGIERRTFQLDIIQDLIDSQTCKSAHKRTPSESRLDISLGHTPLVTTTGSKNHRCTVCQEKTKVGKRETNTASTSKPKNGF